MTAQRWVTAARGGARRLRELNPLELQRRVARLEAELADVQVRGGQADDAIAGLTDAMARVTDAVNEIRGTLDADLAECRRLSLRVAHATDLVMDRLADAGREAQPA